MNVKRRIALAMLSVIVLAMVAFGAVSCGGSGEAGADGKSAYEIWLELGYQGTKVDFLDWLKGAQGEQGEQKVHRVSKAHPAKTVPTVKMALTVSMVQHLTLAKTATGTSARPIQVSLQQATRVTKAIKATKVIIKMDN